MNVIEGLNSPQIDIVEKRVARSGYVGLEVYIQDQEVSNDEIDGVVKKIESSFEDISSKTVEDFKRKQRMNSCICWSVILILITNYYWPWISLLNFIPGSSS